MNRGRLLVAMLLALVGVNVSPTVVHADSYIYDEPTLSLVEVDATTAADNASLQVNVLPARHSERSWSALDASTNPSATFVATNNISWRGTNMSVQDSIDYHWRKHGSGESRDSYAQAALDWASQLDLSKGTPVMLADGTPGFRIRTSGGGPGGIVDASCNVITCWYQ